MKEEMFLSSLHLWHLKQHFAKIMLFHKYLFSENSPGILYTLELWLYAESFTLTLDDACSLF